MTSSQLFSVKKEENDGKICLQGYFKRVFESILHSGARGCSKVYARRALAIARRVTP